MKTFDSVLPSGTVDSPRLADLRRLALIALTYAAAFKLSLHLPGGASTLAAIWPSSGVALAAFLLSPRRKWGSVVMVIFLTGNLVSLLSARLSNVAVGFMVVNVLEAWTCGWLMTRWCGEEVRFTQTREVVALAACAYGVNGVFAVLGAALATAASDSSFKELYLTWWIADGLGLMIVTPIAVVCAASGLRSATGWIRRLPEAAALGLLFCASAWLGFRGAADGLPVVPRPYLVFVPLVWAALRFGCKGTAALLTALAVIAIGVTTSGRSEFPLGGRDFGERLHMVQFFLSVVALTGLVLAAVVDERQRAIKIVDKFDLQFRRFMRQLPGFAFIKGADGRLLFANEGFASFLGREPQTLLGKTNREFFPLDFAEKVTADDERILGTSRDEEIEYDFAGRSFLARKFAITGPDGPPVLGGIVYDITDRRRAEMAMRESYRKFQILFESSYDAIMTLEPPFWRFTAGNPATVRMFGARDEEEFISYRPSELSPDRQPDGSDSTESVNRMIDAAVRDGSCFFEWTYRRINGQEFLADVLLTRMFQGGMVVLQATVRDITARKRADAERQQFERRLQEAQKLESLGVLAGGIAHDFNNVLTCVMGHTALLADGLPADSPLRQNLAGITSGSAQAADLCKQLMAYSGRGSFVIENVSLNAIVEETARLLRVSISRKTELRFGLHPDLIVILADATQLRQVIMNLVINASEAIGDKGGVIDIRTGLAPVDRAFLNRTVPAYSTALAEGTYAYLEVADSGSGMSPETQAKIFDPFFTTKFSGRGLGLATVLGIIHGHKGALQLHSKLGSGTTFRVLLPCADGPPASDLKAQPVVG